MNAQVTIEPALKSFGLSKLKNPPAPLPMLEMNSDILLFFDTTLQVIFKNKIIFIRL